VSHVDEYARSWAASVGVAFDVARLSFTTAPTLAVRIDEGVIADQQRTTDLYSGAGLIARGIDSRAFFNASFNDAVSA
jgi:sulfonate transport system substrate-binding protein